MNKISSVNQTETTPIIKTSKISNNKIKQSQTSATSEIKEMPKVYFGRDLVKIAKSSKEIINNLKLDIYNLQREIYDIKCDIAVREGVNDKTQMSEMALNASKSRLSVLQKRLKNARKALTEENKKLNQ